MKIRSSVRGIKKHKGDIMSCDKSYDLAYKLTDILRKDKKKITDEDDVIIYPSSWYDGYFEITLRDKNNSESYLKLNTSVLMEIVEKHCPLGWVCYDGSFYGPAEGTSGTPVHLKFCPEKLYGETQKEIDEEVEN